VSARLSARRLSTLPDADLLQLRFCDLPIHLDRSRVSRAIARLRRELRARGIRFAPHVWLAEEWFSPDGVPGFAVPFYLAHPRLMRLERAMTGQVEGGNINWLMRILRHEAGHAIDNAYRLRRQSRWREVFGPSSLPYPNRYRARPGSRRYVHHLGDWYAQAHPTEDFAETFGVWLQSRHSWRRNYADWPAMHKLTLVDELMRAVAGTAPAVSRRLVIEPLAENQRTLAEHYRQRELSRIHHRRGRIDELLQRVFVAQRPRADTLTARSILQQAKKDLVPQLMHDCAVDRYTAHQILRKVRERLRHTRLYQRGSRRETLRNLRWMLASLTQNYFLTQSPILDL
jgi:hypothetical protein